MPEQLFQTEHVLTQLFPAERERVVRLAAAITGQPEAAEDLAQEALLEAWGSRDRLVDPAGAGKWLSAITRNVCLRYLRRQGRAAPHTLESPADDPGLAELPADGINLEIELEQSELAELLDRAMAQLPVDTRTALVQRFVLELPQAEIAARLGLTEGAVEARLQRGKLSLRRLLVSDFRAEAVAFGLAGPTPTSPASWVETRLWCSICGQHHLYGTLPRYGGQFELHCPHCTWLPQAWFAQSSMMPGFEQVKGFRATLKRLDAYIVDLFTPRLTQDHVTCRRCGHRVPIQFELPDTVITIPGMGRHGLYIKCPECGSSSYDDIYGIALETPLVQRFWRANPRMHTLPAVEQPYGQQPALLIRFESLSRSAACEVILSRDRYAVLDTHQLGGSLSG